MHESINDGTYGRFHLMGPTESSARDIMVEGPSGILSTAKRRNRVKWNPTRRLLRWENGALAYVFSAEDPERLRGEQCEAAWLDELASWRYEEAYSQLQFGLRLGPMPRSVVTTTPRPTRIIKRLKADPRTHLTTGSTYANKHNLSDAFVRELIAAYEGTRFGRQEIHAEVLADTEFALWSRELLDNQRVAKADVPKQWKKIVVAIDPAVSFAAESAETGIVVAGLDRREHGYVLADVSGRYRPEQWARRAVGLYHEYQADRIVAEKNQGGDLVERNILIEDPTVPVRLVQATRNKILRAEPVATAYERGRVWHVGFFEKLEQQMCEWEAGSDESPDRLDALVWALTDLVVAKTVISVAAIGGNELAMESNYWRMGGVG